MLTMITEITVPGKEGVVQIATVQTAVDHTPRPDVPPLEEVFEVPAELLTIEDSPTDKQEDVPLSLGFRGDLSVTVHAAIVPKGSMVNAMNPYVVVDVPTSAKQQDKFKTAICSNTSEPSWLEKNEKKFLLNFDAEQHMVDDKARIRFEVYDKNMMKDELIGVAYFPLPKESPVTQKCVVKLVKADATVYQTNRWSRDKFISTCYAGSYEKGVLHRLSSDVEDPDKADQIKNQAGQPCWISFSYSFVKHTTPPHDIDEAKELEQFISNGLQSTPFMGTLYARIISATNLRASKAFSAVAVVSCTANYKTKAAGHVDLKTSSEKSVAIEHSTTDVVFNEVIEMPINLPASPGEVCTDGTKIPETFNLSIHAAGGMMTKDTVIGSVDIPIPKNENKRIFVCKTLESKDGPASDASKEQTVTIEYGLLGAGKNAADIFCERLQDVIMKEPSTLVTPNVGHLVVTVLRASGVRAADFGLLGYGGRSDPYAIVRITGAQEWQPHHADEKAKTVVNRTGQKQTSVKKGTLDPVWNEHLVFDMKNFFGRGVELTTKKGGKAVSPFYVEIWDQDTGDFDDFLGYADLAEIYYTLAETGCSPDAAAKYPFPNPKRFLAKLPLKDREKDKKGAATGSVELEVAYIPFHQRYYMDSVNHNIVDVPKVQAEIEAVKDDRWKLEYAEELKDDTILCGTLSLSVLGASKLRNADEGKGNCSDPFVRVKVPVGPTGKQAKTEPSKRTLDHVKFQTEATHGLDDTLYPIWKVTEDEDSKKSKKAKWNFNFEINWPRSDWPKEVPDLLSQVEGFEISVLDKDLLTEDFLGSAKLPLPNDSDMFPKTGFRQQMLVSFNQQLSVSPKNRAGGKACTGEVIIEYMWSPSGCTIPRSLDPVVMGPAGEIQTLKDSGRKVIIGELKITIRSASNLEKFKRTLMKAHTKPFAKVIVPRCPTSICGKKSFPDHGEEWRLPTVKDNTQDPSWGLSKTFTVVWCEAELLQRNVQVQLWHESGMLSDNVFLGEVAFPIPVNSGAQWAPPDPSLKPNVHLRKEGSGSQGKVDIECVWKSFMSA